MCRESLLFIISVFGTSLPHTFSVVQATHAFREPQQAEELVFSGVVTDELSKPIAGARVLLTVNLTLGQTILNFSTATDDQGNYELSKLQLNYTEIQSVTLSVFGADWAIEQCRYSQHRYRSTRTIIKWLPPAPQRVVSNFRLPRRSQKVVTVVDMAGQPVPDVRLLSLGEAAESRFTQQRGLFHIGFDQWDQLGLTPPVSNRSGQFANLPIREDKNYDVTCEHPKYGVIISHLSAHSSLQLSIGSGEELTIKVDCEKEPQLVSEMNVHIGGGSFNTDQEGILKIRLDVQKPRDSVFILPVSSAFVTPRYVQAGPSTREANFSVMRMGKLKGRVIDFHGNGIADVFISPLYDPESPRIANASSETRTNVKGKYELNVPEGSLVKGVSMKGSDLWDDSQVDFAAFDVTPNTEFDSPDLVALMPRREIVARVVTGDREPAQRVVVVATRPHLTPKLTDQDGEFSFSTYLNTIYVEAIDPYKPNFAFAQIDNRLSGKRVLLPNGKMGGALVAKPPMVMYLELLVDLQLVNAPLQSKLRVRLAQQGTVFVVPVDKTGLAKFSGLKGGEYKLTVEDTLDKYNRIFETNVNVSPEAKRLELDLANGSVDSINSVNDFPDAGESKLPILKDLNWLGNRSTELECEPGENLVVCINPFQEVWSSVDLIQQLYGTHGFKVIGLWPRLDQADTNRSKDIEGISFPIIEDGEFFQLSEKFDIPEPIVEWPVFAIFDSQGRRLAHGSSIQQLIRAVRTELLKKLD